MNFSKSIYLLVLLLIFSCKKQNKSKTSNSVQTESVRLQGEINKQKSTNYYAKVKLLDCNSIFKEIILESDIAISNEIKKKKIAIQIDEMNKSHITARVNLKTDVNDLPLKWVEFVIDENKLFDITDDENKISLKFDTKIFQIFKKNCLSPLENKNSEQIKYQDYNTIDIHLYSIKNNSLNSVYHKVIKSDEFKELNLLNSMPKSDTMSSDNNKNINYSAIYKVGNNKLDVEISYPGGITLLKLYKQRDSIILKKIYSPD